MTPQVPGVPADHPKHAQLPSRPVDPCVLSGHLDHKPCLDLKPIGLRYPQPSPTERRPMIYMIERVTVGHLKQVEVDAVRMTRARFLEIVDSVLERYPESRDELRSITETMPRFPVSTWIDEDRGCGCLVGEYLVAQAMGDRALVVEQYTEQGPDLIFNAGDRALITIGYEVDRLVKIEAGLIGYRKDPAVVLIED